MTDQEFNALKTLYEAYVADCTFLSERQFNTTIQAITVDLIVVGGLIAGKVNLTTEAKILGTIMIAAFNILVIFYLFAKRRSYFHSKTELSFAEKSLKELSKLSNKEMTTGSNTANGQTAKTPIKFDLIKKWLRDGTHSFCIAIVIACLCSIAALWFKLSYESQPIKQSSLTINSNKAVKHDIGH